MNMDLTGKVAVVCGAGAPGDGIGNGRASAITLARQGAKVVCVDRIPELAERTVQMIEEELGSGCALAVEADVTREADCASVVAQTLEVFGGLHLLNNNVGVGSRGNIVDDPRERWEQVMRINVDSVYWMSRLAIPEIDRCGGGAIVNVSSIAAMRPHGLTAYSTSKGAVITLTEAMAVDHAAQGIRVNCVAPGPMYTPGMASFQMTPERRQARIDASLLKIEGTGWDVGNAVLFLLSDAARYITGQTLVVDGGVMLRGPGR